MKPYEFIGFGAIDVTKARPTFYFTRPLFVWIAGACAVLVYYVGLPT